MTACDICGKRDVALVDLVEQYQTSDIKQICEPCRKSVDLHLFNLKAMAHKITATWLQRLMSCMKERSQPK